LNGVDENKMKIFKKSEENENEKVENLCNCMSKVVKILIYLPPLFRFIQRCLFTVFFCIHSMLLFKFSKIPKISFFIKKNTL